MQTEYIIAMLIKLFNFKSMFVVRKYLEENNKSYEKIIKCLLFNDFYKNSYLVSDSLKKFIYNSLFKKESLILLDNENSITEFIIAYNHFKGYIAFKKSYESHKFNYIKVMGIKNNKFLFISIKSEIIDKCKTYIVVNKDLYDSIMNDYDLYDSFKEFKLDIFNNCLIKDKKLRPYETKCLNLESLIDIFYSYKKSIKIDNETYSLKISQFDNDSYLRYLVSDYYDYYATKNSLNEFYEYLTDYKGLKLNMTLNEWFNLKIETYDYDYVSMVYYIQLVNFIKSNKKLYKDSFSFLEYKKFLNFILELQTKNIKFNKDLILFILENKTHIKFKQTYKEFLESL